MAEVFFPSRSAIASSQFRQLCELLDAASSSNRFYQKKFAALGLDNSIRSLEDFSERFPFTTKQEIADDQKKSPPYGTDLTFPLEEYTRCHQTSGTSGLPIRWLDTPESWCRLIQNWREVYRAAGVTRGDRILYAFSFGPFIGFWLAFEAAAEIDCFSLTGGGLSSGARLRAIFDHNITVVCCTPTYAIRLAEVAVEEKIDLSASRVKTIIVAGEPGGSVPNVRSKIETLWCGARVFDHHGMTEVGPVTYECPARAGVLHVIEDAYFAEVIDPSMGKAVRPGESGELVLTTLCRIGSPLIRYRTGDLVKIFKSAASAENADKAPCPCGRQCLALEGGILGRIDDMIIVRGVNVFPGAVEEILRRFDEISEYRATISNEHSLAEISIEIELRPGIQASDQLRHLVEKAFVNALALRVPVNVVQAGTLPRFELKAKRWIKSNQRSESKNRT